MQSVENGGGAVTPPLKLASHLDWLEITFPVLGNYPKIDYPENWDKTTVETKAFHGYSVGARYQDGRIEMSNPDHPSMGIHVQFSAQTLSALKTNDHELLEFFIQHGARITRLDCALDVFELPIDFAEIWELVVSGDYECRLRKPPTRTMDAVTGDTIYFGRMKSSVFTRIYNKSAEQNTTGNWTRIETVFRHSRANNAAKLMVKRHLEPSALIRGHVNLPRLAWWTDVMTNKAEKTRLDPVSEDKRLQWLLGVVPKALAKEIYLRGDGLYDQFKARVIDELNNLTIREHGVS